MIEVLYSCPMCRTKDHPVQVVERGNKDVKQWMEAVQVAVSDHHHERTPWCVSPVFDLKIPWDGSSRVGEVPRQ